MIKKILVPTDGSERAEKAAEYAIGLAKDNSAVIVFLSVVDEASPAFAFELESIDSFDPRDLAGHMREIANSYVGRLQDQAEAAGVTAQVRVREGHPWQQILEETESSGADAIVMGSHGRRALAAAVLGNVAFNVIHGAQVPVTLVPVR